VIIGGNNIVDMTTGNEENGNIDEVVKGSF